MSSKKNGEERAPLLGNAAVPDPLGNKSDYNTRSSVTLGDEQINGGAYHDSHSQYETPVCTGVVQIM